MLNLIIDVETSVTKIDGKHDPSPYRPGNRLVSVGWVFVDRQDLVAENGDYIHGCTIGRDQYVFLDHNDFKNPELARRNREKVQAALDNADRLVGHNLKFDLQWLLEAGFKFEGDLYCTQIGEYVLARGQKWPLSLEANL